MSAASVTEAISARRENGANGLEGHPSNPTDEGALEESISTTSPPTSWLTVSRIAVLLSVLGHSAFVAAFSLYVAPPEVAPTELAPAASIEAWDAVLETVYLPPPEPSVEGGGDDEVAVATASDESESSEPEANDEPVVEEPIEQVPPDPEPQPHERHRSAERVEDQEEPETAPEEPETPLVVAAAEPTAEPTDAPIVEAESHSASRQPSNGSESGTADSGVPSRNGRPGNSAEASGPGSGSGEGGGNSDDIGALVREYRSTLESALRDAIQTPAAARRRGLSGTTVIEGRLDSEGVIQAARVYRSSGHDILDEAALDGVRALGQLPAPPARIATDVANRSIRIPVEF
ncbi:MAG: TonB family protein [Myxococcales bacterium]|nr:TonB family protein [Myxococcales bacterium]